MFLLLACSFFGQILTGHHAYFDGPHVVRRGGRALKVYKNSLGLALLTLFLVSFLLHAEGGARAYSEE